MNKKGFLLEELKKLSKSLSTVFSELPAETPTEGELKVSIVEIGGKVELIDADGTIKDAPDGEYQVGEDLLKVKDGLIEAINGNKGEDKPAKEEMPEVPAPAKDDFKSQVDAQAQAIEELKIAITSLQEAFSAKENKEAEMAEQFNAQVKELNDTIKTLASIPVEFSKTSSSITVKDAKEEKFQAALSIYAKRV